MEQKTKYIPAADDYLFIQIHECADRTHRLKYCSRTRTGQVRVYAEELRRTSVGAVKRATDVLDMFAEDVRPFFPGYVLFRLVRGGQLQGVKRQHWWWLRDSGKFYKARYQPAFVNGQWYVRDLNDGIVNKHGNYSTEQDAQTVANTVEEVWQAMLSIGAVSPRLMAASSVYSGGCAEKAGGQNDV